MPAEPLITLPLDLTLDSLPVRVTRIGTDAVVYHELQIDEATNQLIRSSEDIPVTGLLINDATTAQDIAAHIANPPVVLAPLRFNDWLSFYRHVEHKAPGAYNRVAGASLQSAALFSWFSRASGQGEMYLDHPDTITGFAALVAAGVLTQTERDAIFSA